MEGVRNATALDGLCTDTNLLESFHDLLHTLQTNNLGVVLIQACG